MAFNITGEYNMKRNPFYARISSLALAAVLTSVAASAQGYYDDDIYFDPSKAKKEQPAQKKQPAQQQAAQQPTQFYYDGASYVPWTGAGDFQAADSYAPAGTSTRDVDEYNRHYAGSDLPADSISLEQLEEMSASMSNTRNLARFHNSDAARQAYADGDADGYYADAQGYYDQGYNAGYNAGLSSSATTVNLTVGSCWPYYGYNSWRWPYYTSWGWNPWYNPYYSWTWAPSWDWGWGWAPAWSWGWGPSWSWGWGPSWGWGGAWVWAPPRYYNNPPGATRPNRPMGNGSYANRPGAWGGSTRGSIANSNGRRPSNGSNATAGTSRPGYSAPIGRPSTAGSSSGTYSRGRAGYTTPSTGTSNSRNTYTTPSNNSSRPTYNNNSNGYSRGRSSSSGSYSSGRSSGGFSGGGATRSSGGGGGRRGR